MYFGEGSLTKKFMNGEASFRVAHYMPGYPAGDGTTTFCRGLSRAMNRLEPGSCVIITRRADAAERAEAEDELLVYRRASRNPFALPLNLERDLRENRHGIDGVVLHGVYNPPNVGMSRLLCRLGIPYIFLPHDPYPPALQNHHRFRKLVYWKLFEERMIKRAAAVQLLDEGHEGFLRNLGCQVPIFSHPNGCESETLNLLKGEPHVPGSRKIPQLHYLGRMDRNHKGLDLLIEAFSKVVGEHSAKLCLTGNDWFDREGLEKQAADLGISNQVEFRGRRPEPSIQLQADSDLCVLTSRFDGFGLTIVEAMLAGRPVVVSRAAGVAGHVEKSRGGWVVEPTVAGIVRGMNEALEARDQWPEMGERNREYVLNFLTWEQVAKATLASYRRFFEPK